MEGHKYNCFDTICRECSIIWEHASLFSSKVLVIFWNPCLYDLLEKDFVKLSDYIRDFLINISSNVQIIFHYMRINWKWRIKGHWGEAEENLHHHPCKCCMEGVGGEGMIMDYHTYKNYFFNDGNIVLSICYSWWWSSWKN